MARKKISGKTDSTKALIGNPQLIAFSERDGGYIPTVLDGYQKTEPWPTEKRRRWAILHQGVPHKLFAGNDAKMALSVAREYGLSGCSLYMGISKLPDGSIVYKFQQEV